MKRNLSLILCVVLVAVILNGCGGKKKTVLKEYGRAEIKAEMQKAANEMDSILKSNR